MVRELSRSLGRRLLDQSARWPTWAVCLLGGWSACGPACVSPREFAAPSQRLTRNSAYAEHARLRVDVDLLASQPERGLVNLGLTVTAIRDHLDFTANLAHAALGIASLESKLTFVTVHGRARAGPVYALGGRVGFSYVDPRAWWWLPSATRTALAGVRLAAAPIELWQTVHLSRWSALHLGLGYRALGLSGALSGERDDRAWLLDTQLGQRAFVVQPGVDLFAGDYVAIRLGARLPVYTRLAAATSAAIVIEPGVVVGVRSVEWVRRPLSRTAQLTLGIEVLLGRHTYLQVGLELWGFRPWAELPLTPSLNLHWRFG